MKKIVVAVVASILTLMLSPKVFAQTLTADAGNDTLICFGTSVVLGGNPNASGGTGNYTYAWTPAAGLNLANIGNPVASPNVNTSYVLIVTDGVNTASDTVVVSVLPLPTVNAGPDITICQGMCASLTATGGINYAWSPAISLSNPMVPNPTACPITTTIYTVTITNLMGCSATDDVTVIVAPQLNVAVTTSFEHCGHSDGSICATAFGGVPPYNYMWSSMPVQSTSCAVNIPTGNYSLTVTDASGCMSTSMGTVLSSGLLSVIIANVVNASNGLPNGSASASVSGGTGPYTFNWSSIPPQYSSYLSNVLPGLYYVTVTDSYGCTGVDSVIISNVNYPNEISGNVFGDLNNDGIQNVGETGLPNVLIKVAPVNFYHITDSLGHYSFSCPSGTFDVFLANPPLYSTTTPSSYNIALLTAGTIDSLNNFALHQLANVKELEITATPYSAPRPGFVSVFNLTYKNNGTIAMSGNVEFVFDNHYSFVSANPVQTGITSNNVSWNFTNLLPGTSSTINISLILSTSTSIGTNITSVANISPIINDTIPINNTDSTFEVVVGSYDPNDKSVDPPEELPETFYNEDLPLTYTIRFQNTGTAEAYNIYVSDTLSPNLNIETLEMLAASHSYTLQLSNNNVLTWTFANIMLPDSNANEPQSHGFIKYSIKPLQTLGDMDSIKNTAYIYFDFNDAVVTNTVNSYLGTSVNIQELYPESKIKVFPNPVNGIATFDLSAVDFTQGKLLIYDELSKLIYASEIRNAAVKADCGEWKNGFYFYLVKNTKGQVIGKGKFVVN